MSLSATSPMSPMAAPGSVPVRLPLALEAVKLELALDVSDIRTLGFAESVRAGARRIDGEYLFDLPASGLAAGYQRIAVVRASAADQHTLLFVLLEDDGETLSVAEPNADLAGLAAFAEAFVELLQRL